MSAIEVETVTREHADALAAFFSTAGSTCFCRYWHFTGDKNAWLERAAFSPETGEQELRRAIASGEPSAQGLCAVDRTSGEIVGWLKLAPMTTLPKLRNLAVYRRLEIDAPDSLAIGCILVHPEHRAAGIARSLVRAAIQFAKENGAQRLFAFPRRAEARLHDEEAWMGPYAGYIAEGFAHTHGEVPYPVLTHPLTA